MVWRGKEKSPQKEGKMKKTMLMRAALTAVRPALSQMTRKQRQQVCADIAGRLYSKRKGSDRNTYAALSRASRRRPAHPMDLGKRIMASRNANYHK